MRRAKVKSYFGFFEQLKYIVKSWVGRRFLMSVHNCLKKLRLSYLLAFLLLTFAYNVVTMSASSSFAILKNHQSVKIYISQKKIFYCRVAIVLLINYYIFLYKFF